jgi:MtaA/CmuA family methyltransferase
MPDISKDDRVQMWCETCRIVKHHFGSEKCVRGNCDQTPFSLASMMRSPAEWMIDLFDASPLAERLLEFCTNVCLQFIELVAATGVDMLSNGDSPAGPEMVSPAMYRKFAFPYEKRLAEASHRLRLPYALHICGNTALILEDMVLTGTDAIELDFKTELRRIHRVSGDRVTLFGTIDPSGVLKFGTPADVKRKVAELLEVYRDSPRLVVNAGCALPPDCPEQNIRALTETARHPALQTSG